MRLGKTVLRFHKKRAGLCVLNKKIKAKKKQKKSIKDIDQKQRVKEKCPKTKSIIAFDPTLTCSVKCLAVKKNISVKPTRRFFSRKMLFSKISIDSLAYDFTETFFLPNNNTGEIYSKYVIERVFPYSVLTDYRYRQHQYIFHFYLQTGK